MAFSLPKIFITFCFSMLLISLKAQDPQLSQFYASPIYTNPAFAGAAKKLRITSNARNQYTGLSKTYRTVVASLDAYMPGMKSGLGLLASADQAGDGFLTTVTLGATYAYNLAISRNWSANFGIMGEIRQRSYDFNKFVFGDQLDPVLGNVKVSSENPGQEKIVYPNFAVGALLYNEYFYGGFAVHNLLEPNQSFFLTNSDNTALLLPRRYTAHAGANIILKKARYEENRVVLSPNILFMNQREYYQVNLGTYLRKQSLTVGMWYRQTSRNADAIILLLGLRLKGFRLGYSYDITVSNARTATVGSHEISIGIDINTPKKTRSRYGKPLNCPDL